MVSCDYNPPIPIKHEIEPIRSPIIPDIPTDIEVIEENGTAELANVQSGITRIYEEQNHVLLSRIERKTRNTPVERMFEKLRLLIEGWRGSE